MTEEEMIKLVEENTANIEAQGKTKLFFCRTNDDRYAIAVVNISNVTVQYHLFNFAEIMAFNKSTSEILNEDAKRRTN